MLCKKAKDAEGKDVARNLLRHPLEDFRHPLKISLPPPGRNPETVPVNIPYNKLQDYTTAAIRDKNLMRDDHGVLIVSNPLLG